MNKFPFRCVSLRLAHPSNMYIDHMTIGNKFDEHIALNHDQSHPRDAILYPRESLTLQFLQKFFLLLICVCCSLPQSIILCLGHTIIGNMKIIPMESE